MEPTNQHSIPSSSHDTGPSNSLPSNALEERLLEHIHQRHHISRNTNQAFDAGTTFGQRLADRVASFGGSWTFILIFAVVLVIWVVLNTVILVGAGGAFDPYPFILLNLFLSMISAIQAPIIMMSQNRQATKDRLTAEHDYEVNLKAELEIMTLHDKLDRLREQQWMELVAMQQQQIDMLTALLNGRATPPDESSAKDRE